MNADKLDPAEVWREMRLHMEWNEGLSLCFLFAPDGAAVFPLLQWADDAWAWRTAPMRKIEPNAAPKAYEEVLLGMQEQVARLQMTRAPVWVQMLVSDSPTQPGWDAARAALLARLNESREWLVREFARPLIICLPLDWQQRVVQVAPDLWQVRSFSAAVAGAVRTDVPHPANDPQTPTSLDAFAQAQLQPLRQTVNATRARLAQRPDQVALQRELSMVLDDFGDAFLNLGRTLDALAAYRESLALCRQLRSALGEGPQVLRDLSVSLNKVGDAENAAGRGEAALEAYRESLALRRQLRSALGEGPQVLRDLSVSLDNVGDAENAAGRGEAALEAYRESLALCRQLRSALGEGPQVLDDLAVSLERLGTLAMIASRERTSLLAEALALREQLVAAMPKSSFHAKRFAIAKQLSNGLAAD